MISQATVLTPITITTWKTKMRKIVVQVQQGQVIPETPISKITRAK
jgi:hypothetical protein